MRDREQGPDLRTITHVARYVWVAVAFIFAWLHFSYVRQYLDWRIYSLYFLAVAGIACRYLTGIRHGHERWHRVVFDGLTILLISVGVGLTGGIRSELWLLYFIFVIAETLAASARGFLITDVVSVLSYVIATWPREPTALPQYVEQVVTRVFFLILVSGIARTIASEERRRTEDLSALRETLSVSEERRHLARDLHDGIGHVLTRVILSLELARRQCAGNPQAAETVGSQATALRGAMEEMRQIVATLRTETAAFDLQAAVRAMAAQLAENGSLEVDVRWPDRALPLSAHRQYHLLRVIQEALTNCLRHSGAPRAEVEIQVGETAIGPPKVTAVVRDEGRGFDLLSLNGKGHGLQGMSERLAPYGGTVSIESSPETGTRVTAELPGDLERW